MEIVFLVIGPCNLLCENKVAISISHNPAHHDRTKHVEMGRHFIKEKLEEGVVTLPYILSKEQLVDVLIKVVNGRLFEDVWCKIIVCDPIIQVEGECRKISANMETNLPNS